MTNKFEVLKQADKESAAAEAGEYLNLMLIDSKKLPVLLLLSGGSAFAILDYIGKTALGPNLTVCVLDERFSLDDKINNFAQLQKTDFYKDALDSEASFFGTFPRSNETIEQLAQRWEANLKRWQTENPKGLILATIGMGPDGHTAGIFPEADENKFNQLFNSETWVRAYNAEGKSSFPQRVTTTLTFLKSINIGYALVCGTDKKQKLDEVINNAGKVNSLPALAWHDIKELKVFTDIS